jgi:ligand-binding sensor domain-containing protein
VARRRNGAWKTFGAAHGLPNLTARALAEGPDGAIWVGTMNGVARFDPGRERFVRSPGIDDPYAVRAIAFDRSGRPWFGAFDGLDRMENGKPARFLPRAQICERAGTYYLLARPDGSMWVGASAALLEVRDDKQACHVDKDAASRNDVRHLYVDRDGVLWIGSIGGLSRWVGGKRETLKGNAGPFNTAIYAMVEDDRGSMWVSTPKGLFEIVKKGIDSYADPDAARTLYHAYGVGDGMESSVGTGDGQPNAWRGADGRLYFTTATGLAVVDPSQIEHGTEPPPVYVDRMVANREPIDLRGTRRLAAGTRDLEIEFNALSFVAPDRVTYRYRLEGFDRSWVDSGTRREAFYTNLPPGHYRFRVKAANHSGVWNEEGFTVDFEILPRFYQRAWFVPLCFALIAAAAASLYRMRIAALRAREKELRRAVNEAVASVQVLRGMLPVCASCRRVKQDSGAWRQIEAYVMEHTEATFSHTMCDECYGKMREEDPNLPELGKL